MGPPQPVTPHASGLGRSVAVSPERKSHSTGTKAVAIFSCWTPLALPASAVSGPKAAGMARLSRRAASHSARHTKNTKWIPIDTMVRTWRGTRPKRRKLVGPVRNDA